MKTQRTNLVARIAMALLAGMMVLALASCGSKNPLAGHTYEAAADEYHSLTQRYVFSKEDMSMFYEGDPIPEIFQYKLVPETLSGQLFENGELVLNFTYKEDGSSVEISKQTAQKVK